MNTPWGAAQHQRTVAEGITLVSTASHGGYHLSPERLAAMPAGLRAVKPWAGLGWYEEDCDWALVALAFPDQFTDFEVHAAFETVSGCAKEPDHYQHAAYQWFRSGDKKADDVLAQCVAFFEANRDKFRMGSQSTGSDGWRCNASTLDHTDRITFEITSAQMRSLGPLFTLDDVVAAGARIISRPA